MHLLFCSRGVGVFFKKRDLCDTMGVTSPPVGSQLYLLVFLTMVPSVKLEKALQLLPLHSDCYFPVTA